jgi:hypothetical protein
MPPSKTQRIYPYSVRRHSDSLMGPTKFSVYRNPGGVRVTELPPSTQRRAWCDADELNVTHLAQLRGWSWIEARNAYLSARLLGGDEGTIPCLRERYQELAAKTGPILTRGVISNDRSN